MAFSFYKRRQDENPVEKRFKDFSNNLTTPQRQSFTQETTGAKGVGSTASATGGGGGGGGTGGGGAINDTYQPPKPQQPQPQQANTGYQDYVNQYLAGRENTANQRADRVGEMAMENINTQGDLFSSRNKTLGNLGDINKDSFNNYQKSIRQGVDLQGKTADRMIGNTRDERENQKYYNEQARRERQKGLEGTLASLGTLDSSAMGNIGAKINMGADRQSRQADMATNERVAQIEDTYAQVQNQAETLIQQEADNFRRQQETLAGALDENSIQYKQAITGIRNQAEEKINGILDQFDSFAGELGLRAQEAMAQNQPTPEELAVKQNEVDEANNAVRTINEILSSDTNPLTGDIRTGGMPGMNRSDVQTTKAKVENIKSLLQLAAAGKLKGQGAMSDKEREMLAKAATSLDYKMTDEAFRSELGRIQRMFQQIAGTSGEQQDPYATNEQLIQQFSGGGAG